jgi:signal peptidase I
MEPTIAIGQDITLDDSAYHRSTDVRRGDIVVFSSPSDTSRLSVKRVVGLPGESVSVRSGRVAINGVQLPVTGSDPPVENAGAVSYGIHVTATCVGPDADVSLGKDAFFALGDNRCASWDSRKFGGVSFAAIRGRVTIP